MNNKWYLSYIFRRHPSNSISMYSKPKGLYIKHRDKSARRLSPRVSDEIDSGSGSEIHLSPRRDVTDAPSEQQWPKHDFEQEGVISAVHEPQPGASSDGRALPERAQQYMVKNDSYKDLTGAKFITVPTPKTNRSKDSSPRTKPPVGSVRSFIQVGSVNNLQDRSQTLKPVGHTRGSYRGYPHRISAKHTHSHIATIRLPSKKHVKQAKMATLRTSKKDGTIRVVKGYHVGQNATVRLHNTGHAIRHLKQSMPSWDRPDGTFKRQTFLSDRKEYYISQFAIELDRPEHDTYMPGDFLTGRVLLEASASIEIRFVELLIIGVAHVHFAKNDPNLAKNGQEILINKRSYMMGTPDGRWNSVITAGKYVSKFKFRLPNHLPATVKYESKEHGFSFEIGYLVKARICDEIGSASTRSTHSINNLVKVLMTRRFPFMIRSHFDIHSIPRALQPVSHSEYVNLSCLPIFLNTASLVLSLDRAVFLAGDDLRVKLTTTAKTASKIKSLICELHQRVQTNIKVRQNFTIMQIHEQNPEGLQFQQNSRSYVVFEFTIPTRSQFVSSFLQGCSLARVTYAIVMTVRFKGCGGILFLECPVGIGPCADPMSPRETGAVPVFNRPKRFPHFSKDNSQVLKTQNGTVRTEGNEQEQAVTMNKSQGGQLLCCCGDVDNS